MERRYPTDLSDDEWGGLEHYVPSPHGRGRPRIHTTREMLDAVFYVLKSGCAWRLVSRDFPPRHALCADPGAAGALYAGLGDGTTLRGADAGEGWEEVARVSAGLQALAAVSA